MKFVLEIFLSIRRLFRILRKDKLDRGFVSDFLRDFKYIYILPLQVDELELLEDYKGDDLILNLIFEIFSKDLLREEFSNDLIEEYLGKIDSRQSLVLRDFWQSSKNFSFLRKKMPDFYASLDIEKGHFLSKKSLWSLSFPQKISYDLEKGNDKSWSIVFVEAQEIDWGVIFDLCGSSPCLFVFYDTNIFYRNLQNTSFVKNIRANQDAILILDLPIEAQIISQRYFKVHGDPFCIDMTTIFSSLSLKVVTLMIVKLLNGDKDSSFNLKHYMRRLCYQKMKESFGDSCLLSIQNIFFWENRQSCNQQFNVYSKELEEEKTKDYRSYLQSIKPLRRRFLGNPPFKVAHVAPLLINSYFHAPSMRTRELLKYYDRHYFQPLIFLTEQNFLKDEEFVGNYSYSYSSDSLKPVLEIFEKQNLPVFFKTSANRYLENANYFAKLLKQEKVDIAIFHEPFATNQLLIKMSDVPIKLFMEHGFYSVQDELDVVIVSHESQQKRTEKLFANTKTKIITNPKVLDTKYHWQKQIVTLRELNLPQNAKVLMTVSNHLNARLSDEMCYVIRKILQTVPNSYFLAVGRLDGRKRKENLIGMGDRVRFLGPRMDAKHLLRSADVYLNEFPIGGGCVIYEAMLAGCPVVTMKGEGFDDASFEGSDYLGDDLAISSNRIEDYINLAVSLLNEPKKYLWWKKEVQERAESRGSIKDYASRHQEILFQCIESYSYNLVS